MARREHSVLKSTVIVSACTGISRLLGLVREIAMAYFFGTTLAKSAFDIAFTIPNLFRRLFGEGALAASFVPVFTESIEQRGLAEANRLAGRVMTMLSVTLLVLVSSGIALVSAALLWMPLGETASSVLPLLRIMLPYMFFICTVALCMAILNSLHHFAVPAFTPVLLNVVWILAIVLVCPHMGNTPRQRIYGVAWAVLAAGSVQLLAQLPVLWHYKLRPRVSFAWKDRQVRKVLLLMGPAALGMGLLQVNTLADRLLAIIAGPWGPAALVYSERLVYLPLGLFATALGTVLLPTFSRQVARAENDVMRNTLAASMRGLMLIVVPAAVGLTVLARPIVSLFFEWQGGEFNAQSAMLTTRAVLFYAPGLIVFSLEKVLVPAFYAMKDTRTPVKIGLRIALLNLVLNVAFVMTWPAGYKHSGLAFATVLSHTVSCAVLASVLLRRIGSLDWAIIVNSWLRTLLAALAMGVVVYFAYGRIETWAQQLVPLAKLVEIIAVSLTMLTGVAFYTGLSLLISRREWALLKRKRGS